MNNHYKSDLIKLVIEQISDDIKNEETSLIEKLISKIDSNELHNYIGELD